MAIAAVAVLLVPVSVARAAEFVYWDNVHDGTIGADNLDGSGGSALKTSGVEINEPEGMAYDPVTNRLYVASEASIGGSGLIAYVNLDGSGGGIFPAPAAAPVVNPEGVVVDPAARIVYWLNTGAEPDSISWALLDGSGGGELKIEATTLSGARRLAVDPTAGLLYWGNADGSFGFAPVAPSGGSGGTLKAKGAGVISGISVDSESGRVFWVEENVDEVFWASLGGVTAEKVEIGTAHIDTPWGLAFDPTLMNPRLYWANEGNATTREGAIGFSGILLGSEGGKISPPAPAPVNGPQDPVIIKSPVSTGQPMIAAPNRQMSCSQGSWAPDYVSSFVYQAPISYAYQWTLNEVPIAGATAPSYSATVSGRYKCIVTATNVAGSTSRTSPGVMVTITVTTRPPKTTPASTPAKLVLLGKARKLKAKPGKLLTLHVQMGNQGTVASAPAKLCLTLTKKAKRALKAGKCVQLGAVAGGATATAKLRLRVKQHAMPGVYKLTITLPGAPATKVTVRVLG